MQALVIKPEIEQRAEEVRFLWLQRNAAVCESHYPFEDLSHLDDRLGVHIDGLRIAGDVQIIRDRLWFRRREINRLFDGSFVLFLVNL